VEIPLVRGKNLKIAFFFVSTAETIPGKSNIEFIAMAHKRLL